MKRSIRPTMTVAEPPQAPAPEPTQPEAIEPAEAPKKNMDFQVWALDGCNYWRRPLRPDEDPKGIQQGDKVIINAACGSDFSYTRIYTQFGYVYALTLGLAAAFDSKGTP